MRTNQLNSHGFGVCARDHEKTHRSMSNGIVSITTSKGTKSQNKQKVKLFRQRMVPRIFLVVWNMLRNLDSFPKIRELLKAEPYFEMFQHNPRFVFKAFGQDYLARGLGSNQRVAAFLHHYMRLHTSFSKYKLKMLLNLDILLYRVFESENELSIRIITSRPHDKEGELSLLLMLNGSVLYTLAFTIVPGWVVSSESAESILISRLQGSAGCYPDKLRIATRLLCGVQPRAALLAALQGCASAIAIEHLSSVSSGIQSSYEEGFGECFRNNYEGFFGERWGTSNWSGFLDCKLPVEERAILSNDQGHRRRARIRRASRKEIEASCCTTLRNIDFAK